MSISIGARAPAAGCREQREQQTMRRVSVAASHAAFRTLERGIHRSFRPLAFAVALSVSVASPDARSDSAPDASSAPASDRVPELQAAVRAIASDRALEGASVGIAILDVDSARLLAAVNEHLALNPASNAKLYTAGAALAILHGEHRYETVLSGKLEGDAVSGPLAVRGYGDPSLTTADLGELVQGLKEYGVTRVEGDVVVDQRFFDEQTTPPAFEQEPNEWASFRAPVSAVALNENCVTLTVRPGAPGAGAHVAFEPPGFVDVEGSIRTAAPGGADTVELALSGSDARMAAKVSGAIAADSRLVRYTRRAEDPRLLAGYALKSLLEGAGVRVSGDVKLGTAKGHVLAKHLSEPLSSLLYALGKQSDNFYAEMVYKSLAGEGKGEPAKSAEAADLVTRWLQRIGASDPGVVIKNGSGLFDANRVTSYGTVALLRWAWRDPSVQPEYVSQLSVGGVDGTLRKRFRSDLTRRRVRAKTGTLDDVISLSGYVLRYAGRGPIAFSILFNHVGGKKDGARHAADRLVELIARWSQ
jgi:serine-type D-Ala-D-Ala carboxypeptidase/endopeptidase (penicillin-binding protein 4)